MLKYTGTTGRYQQLVTPSPGPCDPEAQTIANPNGIACLTSLRCFFPIPETSTFCHLHLPSASHPKFGEKLLWRLYASFDKVAAPHPLKQSCFAQWVLHSATLLFNFFLDLLWYESFANTLSSVQTLCSCHS